jgi:hypothetical protein
VFSTHGTKGFHQIDSRFPASILKLSFAAKQTECGLLQVTKMAMYLPCCIETHSTGSPYYKNDVIDGKS